MPQGSCLLLQRSNAPCFRVALALCGPKPRLVRWVPHQQPQRCSIQEAWLPLPRLSSPELPCSWESSALERHT